MKALVVFDSFFGNTEKLAREIAAALSDRMDCAVARAGEADPTGLRRLDLLVVGSPTRAFKASEQTVQFLRAIPAGALTGVKVAAFDTRADIAEINSAVLTFMVRIFGYAAEPIAKALKRKGGQAVGEPAGFFIQAKEGPLCDGELERAAAWARGLSGGG